MNLPDLLRAAFDSAPDGRPNRAMEQLFSELVRVAKGWARSFKLLDDHAADEVAAFALLKLRDDRTGRIAEILEDPDPANAERRLRTWIQRVIKNKLIDLDRKKRRRLRSEVPFDTVTGRIDGAADHDGATGSAAGGAAPFAIDEPDRVEIQAQLAELDALLADLDALIARTCESLQPRYRGGFRDNVRDLLAVAHERTTMADVIRARGGDPTDRTAASTVHRSLSRVREYLLRRLDQEQGEGAIPEDLAERLRTVVHSFLRLRGAGPP